MRAITSLKYWQRLNLHHNQLTSIDVSGLTGLRILDLYSNQLNTSVPLHFSNLTNLECLNLRNNQLKGTLPWINRLTKLKRLDLRNNTFSGEFPSIDQLKDLEYLGIGGSGFQFNQSFIQTMLPQLIFYGDHFRTSDFEGYWCGVSVVCSD